jgi:hypothetical protein
VPLMAGKPSGALPQRDPLSCPSATSSRLALRSGCENFLPRLLQDSLRAAALADHPGRQAILLAIYPTNKKGRPMPERSANSEHAVTSQDSMGNKEADKRKALITAYQEVCRSYERIDDFRAKLLGFLPLVSGTGLFFLLTRGDMNIGGRGSAELLVPAGIFGMIVTVGLLFYELRGVQRCIRLEHVGIAFERQLGVYGRFRRWPHSVGRFINEPVADAFIYSAVFAAWMFLALLSASFLAAIVWATIVLCAGFVAVWVFYRYIKGKEDWQAIVDDVRSTYAGHPMEEVKATFKKRLRTVDDEIISGVAEAIHDRHPFEVKPRLRLRRGPWWLPSFAFWGEADRDHLVDPQEAWSYKEMEA